MDKYVRSIIEDLLPLYNEDLLSEKTTEWFDAQVAKDPELQKIVEQTNRPLEKIEIKSTVEPDKMFKNIKRKLSIYQLIFMAISFYLAINTSLLNDSFGFIFWYTVLGTVTYLFYKDMKIVFYISMLPIFIWSIGGNIAEYRAGHIDTSVSTMTYVFQSLTISFFTGLIHYLFALIGSLIGLLLIKIKGRG